MLNFSPFVSFRNIYKKEALQLPFSGEGGIRTHAPFRTNGFQDRLVMTTSIPLHICAADNILYYIFPVRRCLFYHICKICVNTCFSKSFPRFQGLPEW